MICPFRLRTETKREYGTLVKYEYYMKCVENECPFYEKPATWNTYVPTCNRTVQTSKGGDK